MALLLLLQQAACTTATATTTSQPASPQALDKRRPAAAALASRLVELASSFVCESMSPDAALYSNSACLSEQQRPLKRGTGGLGWGRGVSGSGSLGQTGSGWAESTTLDELEASE